MNKQTDPYDPHHVVLNLVIDLQSTNLTRQKEILRLREDNSKVRVECDEQRRRANDAELRIQHVFDFLKKPERPADALDVVARLLDPGPEDD